MSNAASNSKAVKSPLMPASLEALEEIRSLLGMHEASTLDEIIGAVHEYMSLNRPKMASTKRQETVSEVSTKGSLCGSLKD